jgi:pimeloyl-ACP methyl ester carboxylesterase
MAVDFTSQALGRIGDGTQYLPEEIRFQTALDYKRTHPGAFNIPNTLHDLTSKLPQIKQPTLVVWGTHDQTLRPDSFHALLEFLPNSQGYPLRTGHVPHQSHPSEFNQIVLEFLSNLR